MLRVVSASKSVSWPGASQSSRSIVTGALSESLEVYAVDLFARASMLLRVGGDAETLGSAGRVLPSVITCQAESVESEVTLDVLLSIRVVELNAGVS